MRQVKWRSHTFTLGRSTEGKKVVKLSLPDLNAVMSLNLAAWLATIKGTDQRFKCRKTWIHQPLGHVLTGRRVFQMSLNLDSTFIPRISLARVVWVQLRQSVIVLLRMENFLVRGLWKPYSRTEKQNRANNKGITPDWIKYGNVMSTPERWSKWVWQAHGAM